MLLTHPCPRSSALKRLDGSSLRRGFLALSLLASVAAPTRLASAQTDDEKKASDDLFRVGLESMLAGKNAEGCPKLAESMRLFPRAGTLFTLADCEAEWGHSATALRHYEKYLLMFSQMDRAEQDVQRAKGREKRALEQKAALEAKVGRVTLVLPPGAPAAVVVKLDGAVVDAKDLDAAVAVDPGDHVVTTEGPNGAGPEQKFTVRAGEATKIDLEVKGSSISTMPPPPPDSPEEPAPPSGGMSPLRIGAFVSGGMGVAALAAGLVMGKMVLDKSAVAEEHCGEPDSNDMVRCDNAEGYDAATSGQSLATGSTVTVFAGVGLLAAGAVMFFIAPSGSADKRAAEIGPYGVMPIISPVGNSGALVGFSRAW